MKEINIKSLIEVSLLDGSVEEGRIVNFAEEGIYMFDGKEGWLVKFEDINKVALLE